MSNTKAYYPLSATKKKRVKKHLARNYTALKLISIPESLNFGIIFVLHASVSLLSFLFNTPLKYVLFPIAAAAGIAKAGLSWHRYRIDRDDKTGKHKTSPLIQAIWDTIQAFGITAAVIAGITANFVGLGAVVGVGIAATFTGLLAASTIYQGVLCAYDFYKAHQAKKAYQQEPSAESKLAYKQHMRSAKVNLFFTGVIALLCTGIVLAMLAGFPLVGAIIGSATCAAAIAYTVYDIYKDYKANKATNSRYTALLSDVSDKKIHRELGKHKPVVVPAKVFVIPAEAGTQALASKKHWVPASAGMTAPRDRPSVRLA